MTNLDAIAEALTQPPFEASMIPVPIPGAAVLNLSLGQIFEHLSDENYKNLPDPMYVICLSREYPGPDPERSAVELLRLERKIGPRRIVVIVSEVPGSRPPDVGRGLDRGGPGRLPESARPQAKHAPRRRPPRLRPRYPPHPRNPLLLNPYQSDRPVSKSLFFGPRTSSAT